MRKRILFIVCAMCICACKPTPEQRARQFILDRAVDPSSMHILSHSEVLHPKQTKTNTFYHLVNIDSTRAFSDSIRIETNVMPEHYYCYLTIEGNDSTGNTCRCNVELAVMPDGDVMFFSKYRDKFYEPVVIETQAQRDTLTNIRYPGWYNEPNVWALEQMLIER